MKLVTVRLCKALGNMWCARVLLLLHSKLSVTQCDFPIDPIGSILCSDTELAAECMPGDPTAKSGTSFLLCDNLLFSLWWERPAVRQTKNNLFLYFCYADVSLLEFVCILNKYKGVSSRENLMVTPKSSFTHLLMAVANILLQGETQN